MQQSTKHHLGAARLVAQSEWRYSVLKLHSIHIPATPCVVWLGATLYQVQCMSMPIELAFVGFGPIEGKIYEPGVEAGALFVTRKCHITCI